MPVNMIGPDNVQRFHQNFPDPPKATGTPDEIMNEFHRVRDMIKTYSANFVEQHLKLENISVN